MALAPGERPETKGAQEAAKQKAQLEYIEPKKAAQTRANIKAAQPKARKTLAGAKARSTRISAAVDDAMSNVGAWTAGFLGAATSFIPGTPAHDLNKTIETIKANVGFDELRALKDAGGTLGQVSEREMVFLQSVLSNLANSQSPEQLRENLAAVKRETEASWGRVQAEYDRVYGGKKAAAQDEFVETGESINGGLPEGTATNQDGTFTLPDGRIIRKTQ